jgi:hypothetical protein
MDANRPPDLEAIRWVVVGMALLSKQYLRLVGDTVDVRRALGEEAADAILALEAANQLTTSSLARTLGISLRPGERIGQALLRVLSEEDESVWEAQHDQAKAMLREIRQAADRLESLVEQERRLK